MSAADLGLAILYNGGPEGLFALGGLPALALCQFLTGTGSSAGISAALKATSQSFAKASRGAAMGVVLSGFGLSAFFYSSLGRAHLVAAADPTCAFLLTLAIGTGLSMFLGATFVRPPLPAAAASTGQYEPLRRLRSTRRSRRTTCADCRARVVTRLSRLTRQTSTACTLAS